MYDYSIRPYFFSVFRVEILQKVLLLLRNGLEIDPLALRTFVCTISRSSLLSFLQQLPLELSLANLYYHFDTEYYFDQKSRALKVRSIWI